MEFGKIKIQETPKIKKIQEDSRSFKIQEDLRFTKIQAKLQLEVTEYKEKALVQSIGPY